MIKFKSAVLIFIACSVFSGLKAQETSTKEDTSTAYVLPRTNIEDTSNFIVTNFDPIGQIVGLDISPLSIRAARYNTGLYSVLQPYFISSSYQLRARIDVELLSDLLGYGNSNLEINNVHDFEARNYVSAEILFTHNFPELRKTRKKIITFNKFNEKDHRPYYFTMNQKIDESYGVEVGLLEGNTAYRYSTNPLMGKIKDDLHVRDLVNVIERYPDAHSRYHYQSLILGGSKLVKVNTMLNAASFGLVRESKMIRTYGHALVLLNTQLSDISSDDWIFEIDQYNKRALVGFRVGYEVSNFGGGAKIGYGVEAGMLPGPISDYTNSGISTEVVNNFYLQLKATLSLNQIQLN